MTLWAYIDERDGRLLEAGLERTIISSSRALLFAEATLLINGDNTCYSGKSVISELIPMEPTSQGTQPSCAEARTASIQQRTNFERTEYCIATNQGEGCWRWTFVSTVAWSSDGRFVIRPVWLRCRNIKTRTKQPIPCAAGSGTNRRGRIRTAPLRRYIDGLAQRQALSALCGYCVPLTVDECQEAS